MKLNVEKLRSALADPKTVILCDTEEKADALHRVMNWIAKPCWRRYENRTCYRPDGQGGRLYDTTVYYISKGYTVKPIDLFIASEKPRLAEILGVEVDQPFTFGSPLLVYRVTASGVLIARYRQDAWQTVESIGTLTSLIENPADITPCVVWGKDDIEDAKAVRRLYPEMKWAARDGDSVLCVFEIEPKVESADKMFDSPYDYAILNPTLFPSLTYETSPVKLEDIV